MGIDIEFVAVIPEVLSVEAVSSLYEEMKALFSAEQNIDKITILKDKDLEWKLDTPFVIPENHTVLEFDTLCRFYAEGYPRGNPLPWMQYADFLEWKYPGCYVAYCGDCYRYIEPWTKEEREKLKLYYYKDRLDKLLATQLHTKKQEVKGG
jgi:hypothetical protein